MFTKIFVQDFVMAIFAGSKVKKKKKDPANFSVTKPIDKHIVVHLYPGILPTTQLHNKWFLNPKNYSNSRHRSLYSAQFH